MGEVRADGAVDFRRPMTGFIQVTWVWRMSLGSGSLLFCGIHNFANTGNPPSQVRIGVQVRN
jgi:hypothetical protein